MLTFSDNPILRGLHYDGYNCGVKNPEKTRYCCIKRGCDVKLRIHENHDPETIQITGLHSCSKSTHQSLEKRLMRETLKEKASNAPSTVDPKSIFDTVCNENESLASSVSYSKMKKTIQDAQNGKGPRIKINKSYDSLEKFYEHLQQFPELLKSKEKSISAELIKTSSKSQQLILYDAALVEEFDNNNDMFANATFKISPDIKGVYQVLTIMCKKHNIVVPCVWVLMTRKNTKAYESVWTFMLNKFPTFQPRRVTCDYEKAFMKSTRRQAFQAHVRGCYFHFAQAIVRKAKSKGFSLFVKDNAIKNPKGHELIKKLLVLPLLPEEKIQEGFEIVKNRSIKLWSDKEEKLTTIINIKETAKVDLERAKKKIPITDSRRSAMKLKDEAIRDAWVDLYAPEPCDLVDNDTNSEREELDDDEYSSDKDIVQNEESGKNQSDNDDDQEDNENKEYTRKKENKKEKKNSSTLKRSLKDIAKITPKKSKRAHKPNMNLNFIYQ
ncbi:hypothetical protein TKK_0002979 [Trichogramma kaykai]